MELLNGSVDDEDVDVTAMGNRLIDDHDDHNDDADDVMNDSGDSGLWQPMLAGLPSIEYSLSYTTTERSSSAGDHGPEVSWKDLGLDGWMGGIKEPGRSFHEHAQR